MITTIKRTAMTFTAWLAHYMWMTRREYDAASFEDQEFIAELYGDYLDSF